MAEENIIDITEETDVHNEPGLSTRLIFNPPLRLPDDNNKPHTLIEIDTYVVPGNDNFPYEILITDDLGKPISRFPSKRYGADEYMNKHLETVNELKKKYLDRH